MFTFPWLKSLFPTASRPSNVRRVPLRVELLESRLTPSGSEQLLLASYDGDSIKRYDAMTSDFIDTFVPKHSGGLNQPYGVLFGPHDGDLYVSTGEFGGPGQLKAVLRFDGDTGAFVENFTKGGNLESPRSIIYGPDGHLYVADKRSGGPGGRVARYDGHTGAYLGDFVSWQSGGLKIPTYLVFGPSQRGPGQLDLYVTNLIDENILRYHGTTGEFLGVYVAGGSGGLESPMGVTFGPDGNLYVADASYQTRDPKVLRFQGPSGPAPGTVIDAFVPAYSSGKRLPFSILFGPDGNGDGQLDLYVNDAHVNTGALNGKDGSVKRFDGATGALIDTVVAEGDRRLAHVGNITFTRTDPVTLAYTGDALMAAAMPAEPVNEILGADQVQPLLTEAIGRWQQAGADVSGPTAIDVRIADLSGALLGQIVGNTLWLDDNAAGWGWFIDPTPWDDSEFTTPGDQGEQNRMDLLTVLAHEIGHLLGHDHEEDGVMQETLSQGERLTLHGVDVNDYSWLVGLPDLTKKRDPFGWWL